MYSLRRSFFSTSVFQSHKMLIQFVTDTEGHLPSFTKSIKKGNVVRFDQKEQLQFCNEPSKSYFIFGGDLTDRGVGDTKLTEMLLDFKLRYPDRVILLVGNREASKTRFFVELNPKYIRERLIKGGAPFWLTNPQLPIDYVKKQMKEKNLSFDQQEEIASYVESLSLEECQLIYLKWMLEQNLSCPFTFNYHAQHLAAKLGCELNEVTDSMVLNSIMEQSSPKGLVGEYIKQTQIAVILPDAGILAVHGGITAENMGRLPTMAPTDLPIDNLHLWIEQFNDWYRLEVAKWANWHDDMPLQLEPARSTLDTFSLRVPSEYRSIVTGSMLDQSRRFIEVPDLISDYLSKNKINIVLTGHQPCGDYPALLRSRDDQVIFINGDTSYANTDSKHPNDTRGPARHSLQILVNEQSTQINIDARLATGEKVLNSLKFVDGKVSDETYIGKILPGNELVQCFLEQNDSYRIIHQEGFKVEYRFRTKAELDLLCKSSFENSNLQFS
ncbi:MAG: metallophosphoesterase [Tatlockia sp.]|nr:metallophosphoesterase [Tatlockia sp.]